MILTEKREREGMATKPPRPSRGDRRGDNGSDKWSGHDVFTTGEAAEICNVSQQTIIRCFDSGRLNGFRVPGSRFRRIPRAELVRFMRSNGIPAASLDGANRRVLLMSSDAAFADSLARAVSTDDRLKLHIATNAYDGGVMTAQFAPHLIVVDVDLPQFDARAVLHLAQRVPGAVDVSGAQVVVVGAALRSDAIEQLTELGAAMCVRKPVDMPGLVTRITTLV